MSPIVRMFKNVDGFRYDGSIHEQPRYKSPVYNNIASFDHYGYMYSDEENYFGMNSIEGNIDLSKMDFEDEEEYYNLFGEIDINSESIVSYLISCTNEIINIKIVYYKGINQGCQKLYEIAEDAGALKKKMESYLNNYLFDDN